MGSWAEQIDTLITAEREDGHDADQQLDDVLREMELEMFFGRLARSIGRAGKRLVKQGIAAAGRSVPALAVVRGVTDLARGNLRAGLVRLARTGAAAALTSAAPWAGPAMSAANALGGSAARSRIDRPGPAVAVDGDPAADAYRTDDAGTVDDGGADANVGSDDLGESTAGGASSAPSDGQEIVDVAERAYELLAAELSLDAATSSGARRLAHRALRRAWRERRNQPPCSCSRGRQ